MSDKLYPIKLTRLLNWILEEEKEDKIFGIFKEFFFRPETDDPFRFVRYGQLLENPVGVAAGPQTQMSQNILISYLMGARYIELKTVQTLDELDVAKPCIEMYDEGYNCEWSQELKIRESFDEYLNAWILIHLLKHKFDFLNSGNEAGFIFNMSVGYDLKGILNPNVQWFLDKMQNCEEELEKKIKQIEPLYPAVVEIGVPATISNNVTLSTMHGCPPDEIESIAEYLISEKKLNTTIKLNPTLLGESELNNILVNKLGFEINVPKQAFEHDLKFKDAVPMIKRLLNKAEENGVEFGLKLTNTLETLNRTKALPKSEQMVYMSGRALHPISINLALKLQKEFNGNLDVSFSAGADAFNVADILKCNLKPITVCSDLLKPGGYLRLNQYFENLRNEFKKLEAASVEDFVIKSSGENDLGKALLNNLEKYSKNVLEDERYKKNIFVDKLIKTERELTAYDCVSAPCVNACAISQDVPQYMYYTANGNFPKALEVIYSQNPLPNITGNVCDHLCQTKCTRINIDAPLKIRDIKKFNAEKGTQNFKLEMKEKSAYNVAVIGAGPAGLAAAKTLAQNGVKVEVYEKADYAGGMVTTAIPSFRMERKFSEIDINNIKSLGVKFYFNSKVTKEKFEEIKFKNNFVFIAVGAQKAKKLNIKGEELPRVFNQLDFLKRVNAGEKVELGKKVAIIGGGNSAMDAARTAKRLVGENGVVTVLYRRTKREMPADKEEVHALAEEGIEIIEKVAPLKIKSGNNGLSILLSKVKLAEAEHDGRPKPELIKGSEFSLLFDSIITAIGQELILDFLPEGRIEILGNSNKTNLDNIFIGGDALRGADSLINAIADGVKVAEEILIRIKKEKISYLKEKKNYSLLDFQKKISIRKYPAEEKVKSTEAKLNFDSVHIAMTKREAIEEAERCLYCDEICNICVTVCPNLANVHFKAEPKTFDAPVIFNNNGKAEIKSFEKVSFVQDNQIINIGDFCNECGNCATFCPTAGAPYKTKPKFFLSEKTWLTEGSGYYLKGNTLKYLGENGLESLFFNDSGTKLIYENKFVKVSFNAKNFSLESAEIISEFSNEIILAKAAEMCFLLSNLKNESLFN